MLNRLLRNAYLNFLSGLVLLGTAGYEIWESFGDFSLGAHHGIAFYGLIQMLKSLPEIMHGMQEVEEARECRSQP